MMRRHDQDLAIGHLRCGLGLQDLQSGLIGIVNQHIIGIQKRKELRLRADFGQQSVPCCANALIGAQTEQLQLRMISHLCAHHISGAVG